MRKLGVASVALFAMLADAGAAHAVNMTDTISASISPKKVGTKAHPVNTSLTVRITAETNPPGFQPDALNRVQIQFPPGAIANGRYFPTCSSAALNNPARGPSRCPKGSRVGTGTLKGSGGPPGAPRDPSLREDLALQLFNGPGGHSIELYLAGDAPLSIHKAIQSPLVRSGGAYRLTFRVPPDLQKVLGISIAVLDLTTRVRATTPRRVKVAGRKRKVGFIETVGPCPRSGRLPVSGVFSFNTDFGLPGGPTLTAKNTIACA